MRFVDSPVIALGSEHGPEVPLGPIIARGPFARAMMTVTTPSTAVKPHHVTEQRFPRMRIRVWYASETGALWMSPGVYELRVLRYLQLWLRAFIRLNREPIPQAWIRR